MKEDGIGYLKITEFDTVTYEQFRAGLESLEKEGMEGLIVDLRDNPGGNLDTVCQILDLMLPEGTIVYTEDKDQNRVDTKTSDEEHQFTKPLAVLVNGNSASASEVFTGAVQDYGTGNDHRDTDIWKRNRTDTVFVVGRFLPEAYDSAVLYSEGTQHSRRRHYAGYCTGAGWGRSDRQSAGESGGGHPQRIVRIRKGMIFSFLFLVSYGKIDMIYT